MKKQNIVLYIDKNGNDECDMGYIGYSSTIVEREYILHLYNQDNYPLKQNENDFWTILVDMYKTNNVRNFFEKI